MGGTETRAEYASTNVSLRTGEPIGVMGIMGRMARSHLRREVCGLRRRW